MNDNEQTQVPEWAKGEGWNFRPEPWPIATCTPQDDYRKYIVHPTGAGTWRVTIHDTEEPGMPETEAWSFPTPEDARHVADCLIAGKVLPSKREKELEAKYNALAERAWKQKEARR